MSEIKIDKSNSLEKQKGPGQKLRAVIAKFTRYKDRYHVFRNKKILKATESLTLKRTKHLRKEREQHGFANV